ncbi:MAG: RDD family protein [Verrucomicrobia bacterium]|nr:MAG: RDD family protein [Verrucomicrobiota bacterium]
MEENAKLDTLQTLELADGVSIRLRVSGPILRGLAYALDLMIRLVIFIAAVVIISYLDFAVGDKVAQGIYLLIWFALDWFYPIVFEVGKHGATPGKLMLGLRVVQVSGAPITLGQAVIRNFMRFIDSMPFFTYGFGLASCVASQRFQRLGDLAAGTLVIYHRMPKAVQMPTPPPLAAVQVPVALSRDELFALAMFRDRASLWSEARRIEIANQATELTGAEGVTGMNRLLGMAHWTHRQTTHRQ